MPCPPIAIKAAPFLAFVYRIAAHKIADAHRALARNRVDAVVEVPDMPETAAGPEQLAMQGDPSRRMKQLLDSLPDKLREIVILRTVVGLSAEETAEAVGSTPGAVRVAQHRALARLRTAVTIDDNLSGWLPTRRANNPSDTVPDRHRLRCTSGTSNRSGIDLPPGAVS